MASNASAASGSAANSPASIRPAQRSDADTLGALWEAFLQAQAALDDRLDIAPDARERWQNDFPAWLDDETYCLLVAEHDATLCGFVTARRWAPPPIYQTEGEVYLTELYVVPEQRSQGIATALVDAVRTWAATVNARRVRLQVLTANAAALSFWRAQDAEPLTETWTLRATSDAPSPGGPPDQKPTDKGRNESSLGFQWNTKTREE
jgi:ribosomal protein S18 acetylase RimI-like enzyme